MSSLCCWTRTRKNRSLDIQTSHEYIISLPDHLVSCQGNKSSPSNSSRAYEAQTVDTLRKEVKAETRVEQQRVLSPLFNHQPSTINHQPSAIDQTPSTSSEKSTISQFAAVGRPTSLNANNSKPATGSHDIQTPHEYIITLPDRLVSCQDEMERLIKNSIADIEKNNEIVREIKRLKDEGKLAEVRIRCYEVDKLINGERPSDYLQKQLNLTYNMIDEDVRKFEQRLNIRYKKNLAVWQDEMKKLIKYSLEPIGENEDEFLSSEEEEQLEEDEFLSSEEEEQLEEDESWREYRESENKLEKVRSRCCEVFELFNGMRPSDYLEKPLNLTFDLRDYDVRKIDVTFYYLVRDEESHELSNIIHRSLYDYTGFYTDNFYELCCIKLFDNERFVQLYKRLNNNQTALEYLLYKKPGLLLNKESPHLINQLIDNTQLDVHQILTNIRDKKGQTCLFYIKFYSRCDNSLHSRTFYKLYFSVNGKNVEDLYELLSIQNCDGQTALHVNGDVITRLLVDIYTPKQREAFIKLTSVKGNSNRTAAETCNIFGMELRLDYVVCYSQLSELMNRVKNNEYVMHKCWDTRFLIIYNTNNRPGAEEEAQTIYNASKSTMPESHYDSITFKKNKNKADITQLIKKSANERIYPNGPPIKSLIVILTSHGNVGTIEDCDGNPIKLSAIEQAMCSDNLDGRPKMLITQCCQNTTPEVDEKLKAYAPVNDDFCAVMSSVPGQKSTRGVFLGKLAEEIKKKNEETDIFKLVNDVSRQMEREGNKQTPIIMSTLKARFCPTDSF